MNHPYYPNPQEKFSKKKILANQQGYIKGQVDSWKEQAIILSVALGIMALALIVTIWLTEDDLMTRLLITAIGAAILLVPLCPAVIYWIQKKKYAYIIDLESPKTLPTHMRCVKVKLWVFRGKYAIGITGVWLFSETGEKFLYIYPQNCRDKKALTIFPDNAVRKQIKATFQNRFLRFWYYEGTDLIYKFEEN